MKLWGSRVYNLLIFLTCCVTGTESRRVLNYIPCFSLVFGLMLHYSRFSGFLTHNSLVFS